MNMFIKSDNLFVEIIELLKKEYIKESDILDIILVGSRLYRIHNENSDYDLIVITKNINGQSFNKGKFNITCFTKESFQDSLNKQKMICLEAFFSSTYTYKYRNIPFKYDLNKNLLIENTRINTKATLERALKNNNILGKKQIWHAIRINYFKDQLLNCGSIHNFTEANWYLEELKNSYLTVEELIKEYKEYLK